MTRAEFRNIESELNWHDALAELLGDWKAEELVSVSAKRDGVGSYLLAIDLSKHHSDYQGEFYAALKSLLSESKQRLRRLGFEFDEAKPAAPKE